MATIGNSCLWFVDLLISKKSFPLKPPVKKCINEPTFGDFEYLYDWKYLYFLSNFDMNLSLWYVWENVDIFRLVYGV